MNTASNQPYLVWHLGLAGSALVAALPIFLLLLLLGVLRRPAWQASLAGLLATALLATTAYGMSARHLLSAAAYGAAFGLFPITWIVFWALVLYRITVITGNFEIIKQSVGSITTDTRLQILLIAFSFGAFLEGGAGFGTPVAVAAAMLTGLGFAPLFASTICLLANTAPVAFGAIGIPIVTLAGITGLPLDQLGADVGRVCAPVSFLIPAYLILVMCGRAAFFEIWPAWLVCGAFFAATQFFVSNFIGIPLTDILSSVVSILALLFLLRVWRPPALANAAQPPRLSRSVREIATAWLPYLLLVLAVLLWGLKPVQHALNTVTLTFPWPALHKEINRVPPVVTHSSPYAALYTLNWLAAAGSSCMVAALLSALCLRLKISQFLAALAYVSRQLLLPTLTVTAVLALAFVMNYCGATGTLGLAFAATGAFFPFFSALLGWLGVFLTGSDTSANALFGSLQVVTANRLGLGPSLMAASNSVGGVMGKMISLQTIAVAAAATGLTVSEQAQLFRFTLRHSLLLAAIVGLEVLFYAYVLHLH